MMRIKYFPVTVMVFFLLSVFSFGVFSAEDELWLEGTAYDSKNPKASVAVINGKFLKTGDKLGNYQVVEVAANWVRVSDIKTGKERDVYIRGVAPPPIAEGAPGQRCSAPPAWSWLSSKSPLVIRKRSEPPKTALLRALRRGE